MLLAINFGFNDVAADVAGYDLEILHTLSYGLEQKQLEFIKS